jgi:Uma2 family endonuclease
LPSLACDLHLLNVDSITFTRVDLARGFAPDACLYIQHTRHCAIVDPPPDLVIGIDMTSPSLNKLPISAAVGIAEVWRYTPEGLTLSQLLQDGYVL